MRNRRFGVEIEFDSNSLGASRVVNILRDAFDRVGYRRWNFSDRLDYDGSELELRTPILSGKEGFKKLELVMNTLDRAGCFTTDSDGLHVHHDAPEFTHNIDNCIRLVKSWKANRHLIYRFVEEYRTEASWDGEAGGYWACPGWTDSQIETMERDRQIPHWDRNDLNLMSLNRHGSIEIRLHEGTLYYPEAKSWILFGQRFIDRVVRHRMYESKDATNLLEKVKVNPEAKRQLLSKAGINPYQTALMS